MINNTESVTRQADALSRKRHTTGPSFVHMQLVLTYVSLSSSINNSLRSTLSLHALHLNVLRLAHAHLMFKKLVPGSNQQVLCTLCLARATMKKQRSKEGSGGGEGKVGGGRKKRYFFFWQGAPTPSLTPTSLLLARPLPSDILPLSL